MTSSSVPSVRVFSVEQANAMLPLVSAIVADIVELSRDVISRRERIVDLEHRANYDSAPRVYAEELRLVKDELQSDSDRLQNYVEELRELGVEPKSGPEGLVDFPAVINGRSVFLCWKLGEPTVSHWHDMDAGFAGRQPITSDCAFQD
ncbi:DUF2203 domain-containing protein [Blastopirellula retiformator]|uniref:DUF2203 domain-containing protein n=1 Tax=Blastopirellula retiformator TaxID=2527970 RepID=A0A5C5V4N7_9BACT|nr:DUF2203 domain-containing protein [Blastopirellula retiformator]TWT33301.1 hypothetical protein Enr8_31270 [Blastopirellula retiformator]